MCVSGCAAPVTIVDYYSVDSDALRKYRRMEVVGEAKFLAGEYARIGRVKGIYCQKQMGDTNTENQREAIDQVKLKAAKLGATHISALTCTLNEGLDMTNNCFDEIVCKAFALETRSDTL
jgi:hypothetical protein